MKKTMVSKNRSNSPLNLLRPGACLLALLVLTLPGLGAQEYIYGRQVKKLRLPDLGGYVTVAGDFHMHTVYSDGSVLPDVRVNEIYREGLGALATTDHAEFSPYLSDLPKNSNRSNELAAKRAGELGLIHIPGTEITRDFSQGEFSGHFVALFIKDVDAVEVPDTFDMLREAKRQGAFLFWCHPPAVWGEEIEAAAREGLFAGIEIVNGGTYFPEAHRWAVEKGLAIFGNSDAHDPLFYGRPVTLVFAAERTAASLREAFLARRTVVLSGSTLYGEKRFLDGLFYGSVKIKNPSLTVSAAAPGRLTFVNSSDINYRIIVNTAGLEVELRREIIIEAGKETTVTVSKKPTAAAGAKTLVLSFKNANMFLRPGVNPEMEFRLPLTIE